MHSFKSSILLFALLGMLFLVPAHRASAIGISIKITFGHGDDCSLRRGICSITIGAELKTAGALGAANAGGTLTGMELTVNMMEAIPDEHLVSRGNQKLLVVTDEVPLKLSTAMTKQVKQRNLVVEPGEYAVDYSKNKMGTLLLKLKPAMVRESPSKSSTGKTGGK